MWITFHVQKLLLDNAYIEAPLCINEGMCFKKVFVTWYPIKEGQFKNWIKWGKISSFFEVLVVRSAAYNVPFFLLFNTRQFFSSIFIYFDLKSHQLEEGMCKHCDGVGIHRVHISSHTQKNVFQNIYFQSIIEHVISRKKKKDKRWKLKSNTKKFLSKVKIICFLWGKEVSHTMGKLWIHTSTYFLPYFCSKYLFCCEE